MTNIISITFFDGGELNISGTETTPIQEKVTDFITKYEPDYLKKVLGYPLWKLFNADGYATPGSQRFKDLLNGNVEFTDNCGKTKLWTGLNASLGSPIADYIWYWFQRDNVSFNTSMGEQKGKAENSSNTTVMIKQMRAYNEMVDITYLLQEFLECATTGGIATYPEFKRCDAYFFRKINYNNL